MNAQHDLDRRLDEWLQDGPSRAPERSIAAALDHARAHPRRRDPFAALRRDPMGAGGSWSGAGLRAMPLVAALGLLLVAGLAVATVGGLIQRAPVVVPPISTPSPSASGEPSPSSSPAATATPVASRVPASFRVDLVDDIGGDAFVEITDLSGTLIDARSGQESEGGEVTADIGVANVPTDPATVVLTWVGCPSDTRHMLTIAPDGRTIALDQPACQGDTLGVMRVLVLMFDEPVPADEVRATIRVIGA